MYASGPQRPGPGRRGSHQWPGASGGPCNPREKIVLVCDNLNTHTLKSPCKAFDKETADRLAAKLEWHYTPPHGSWLNMAECEPDVLARQCLNRHFPEQARVAAETAA